MSYHLAGYGKYQEEALIRLLGEGIERYALVVGARLYQDKIFSASYNDLQGEANVMPWELMNVYTDEDYSKMRGKVNIEPITKDDRISWLWCPSLFEPGKEICVPAQLIFTGFRHEHGEKLFLPGFSKGAAAHTNPIKSLIGAILEAIEADAFMIRWYTHQKMRQVIIDNITLIQLISEFMSELDFEIIVYEYSLPDMPAHSFGVGLLNNRMERPIALLGCSTSLNPMSGVYRALVEALAIHYLATYGPLVEPDHYLPTVAPRDFADLDSNVAYWAHKEDATSKQTFLRELVEGQTPLSGMENLSTGNDEQDLQYLIRHLSRVSKYGIFLDITPPEIAHTGWRVTRTFFPELVQMSLPAFPYSGHPRIRQYGGIRNERPHPLP
ncbi:MAG: streptolysin associated protein SagD [Chloroflexi bacterium]|nr:streptolysin associated protein SagD [Chloroflexota bacterium]